MCHIKISHNMPTKAANGEDINRNGLNHRAIQQTFPYAELNAILSKQILWTHTELQQQKI